VRRTLLSAPHGIKRLRPLLRLFGYGRFGLSLCMLLSLRLVVLDRTHLHAALQNGSILNADALGDHVAGQCSLASDVQTVGALNVALHLAQDHNFAGADVGGDAAVASDGDAVLGKIDGALDAPIDIERFGAADFPFDDHRAADRSLFHGHADSLAGGVGIRG